MRWGDHGLSRAWLFVFAVALIPLAAGAQDENPDDNRGEYELPDVSAEGESSEGSPCSGTAMSSGLTMRIWRIMSRRRSK